MSAFFVAEVDLGLDKPLNEFGERYRTLGVVMADVAEDMVSEVQENFETGGRGKWPDLAPSTKASRRGSSFQILVDTTRLAGSIEPDSGIDFAEAATDVAYAVYHVSDEPRSVIPERDFLELPEEFYERSADKILDYLTS